MHSCQPTANSGGSTPWSLGSGKAIANRQDQLQDCDAEAAAPQGSDSYPGEQHGQWPRLGGAVADCQIDHNYGAGERAK